MVDIPTCHGRLSEGRCKMEVIHRTIFRCKATRLKATNLERQKMVGLVCFANNKSPPLNFTVPSGRHTKNYGKAPFLIGKSTINWPFSIAMLNYQRVIQGWPGKEGVSIIFAGQFCGFHASTAKLWIHQVEAGFWRDVPPKLSWSRY